MFISKEDLRNVMDNCKGVDTDAPSPDVRNENTTSKRASSRWHGDSQDVRDQQTLESGKVMTQL